MVIQYIKEQIDEERQPDPKSLVEFGFNLPARYVLDTCSIWVMSGFQQLPQAGGWDAQRRVWKDDAMTYLRIRSRLKWEYEEWKRINPPSKSEDIPL